MRLFNLLSIAAVLTLSAYGTSWTATPFNPASVPLAVRSPYLSAWLPQGAGTALNDAWPQFWAGATLGWAGLISVDGTIYSFMGAPSNAGFTKATQTSLTFTSTQSTFVLQAGGVALTVNFLSPVDATDLVQQSIPFSYMAITAAATDGKSHAVKLYTDISAEWTSGDRSLTATWGTTTASSILTHQAQLQTQNVYGEVNDQIQQGSVYYSTPSGSAVTYQTGQDTVVRAQFISKGTLANTQDTAFRAIQDDWPVFAFAKDLGTIAAGTASAPTIVSIGYVRDPAVEYIIAGGSYQPRSLYFWSKYSTVAAVITDFINGYSTALSTAKTFDAKVVSDATKISSTYASLVELSVRQAIGAIEITISKTSAGAWDTTDVIVFMKEISSDGNVNTVDVIFPAWPILLYTNPALGKYLLLGLFKYQATGQYPNKWSIHDLGANYPKAIGHNDGKDEAMPVEECGNMLIMTLSHAQKTGDLSLLTAYNTLLTQWTQYLISDSLIPANQLSTDDFAGGLANQTNLAIKGIVGIGAMGQISKLIGNTAAAANFTSIATSYVTKFQTLAAGNNHLTLSYNNPTTWGLTYNMFGDKLLGLNLFPASLYTQQTAWYKTVMTTYGVPLDTRHTYTKSDWSIWTAAIVTDTAVRDSFITGVVNYCKDGQSSQPLGDWYETAGGAVEGFRARPVVGGHLALLLL